MIQIIDPKYFMLNCKYIGNELSYEDYLLDILNASQYFMKKAGDHMGYVSPKSEDNGESDAISTEYQIDFKLLIDEDVMRGLNKNKPSVSREYIRQGIIIVNDNPSPTPISQKNILNDIIQITLEDIINDSLKSDTSKHFIRNIEKNKNLFLYYPYEYVCPKQYSIAALLYMFTQIFNVSLSYRKEKVSNRDTYLCVKVNEYFLVFEWFDEKFIFVDGVHELLCSSYLNYKPYAFFEKICLCFG